MRAITICQPYAHLIVTGAKRVENRTWPTRVTGQVAIHAGKSRQWLELSDDGTRDEDYELPIADMAFGAVVGVADLVSCLPIEEIRRGDHDARFPWLKDHEHAEGPFCFVLENVRRIEPVPFKGAQGFFFVPDSACNDGLAAPPDPLVGPFSWIGDLEDDCVLKVGEWMAHVEMMGDFRAKLDGKKHKSERVEYWYCAVYFRGEPFYHSGEAGGFICSGGQCRAICEAIIRGR